MSCFLTKTAGTLRVRFDWALGPGETVEGAPSWVIVPEELGPDALAVARCEAAADGVSAELSGGRPGRIYHVACRVRTSAGRVLTRGALLRVEG